ncbi:hypothetical protein LTR10_020739 [Elasticomyces elasticus]|uniref:Uncharacterized protein n=1 Tax=Exophiala sideris TaxID=1016849 RepID=A0ABR0JMW7_9EURO|nr:hypothetical protein LTR10_020739 [Elasticomyces elasticus]KAK5067050.1 hypothetical protein LTR69_002399 [Exophiala sideris]KAK5185108.1 hypothetical protein LTR44_002955 [Eurotiomycetes sp. CCFEE 6388]
MSATSATSAAAPPDASQHELSEKFAGLAPAAFEEWLMQRSVEVVKLARLKHASIRAIDTNNPNHTAALRTAEQLLGYAKSLLNIDLESRNKRELIALTNYINKPMAESHPDFLATMMTAVHATCVAFPQAYLNQVCSPLLQAYSQGWHSSAVTR